VMRELLAPLVDELRTDALGNLIGVRRGSGGPRVMIAAHMDEIGFLVRHVDERGFLRLHPVGGFEPGRLPSQRVIVHASSGEQLLGSISVAGKPMHLVPAGERRMPDIDDLFVDVGLDGKTARAKIEVGDMVTLERSLQRAGDVLMTRVLDDRVGLFIMLAALQRLPRDIAAEVVAVATVQEEIGTRGAETAAWDIQPDIGIALDITPAGDFPGAPEEFVGVRLGAGTAIKILDMSAMADVKLHQQLRDLARERGIAHQPEILGRGGTDAGAIQRSRGGVPAIALSVPVRYAHTVNETCSPADIEATIALLTAFVANAGASGDGNGS
jgi:putative aminopeptidase FrvX